MKPSRVFFVCALVALVLIAVASPVGAAPIAGAFNQFVVFGDSLSDTGNVLATTTKYSLFATPRPTTPWYQPGKFTDGPAVTGPNQTKIPSTLSDYGLDWDEKLAQLLGINNFQASANGGTNYATGGAETGSGTFSKLNFANMGQQVNNYIATNPAPTTKTLFALWGGGNDLIDAAQAPNATAATIAAAESTAVDNVFNEIVQLSNQYPGQAVNFLWPDVPPLQATPMAKTFPMAIQNALATSSEQFEQDELLDTVLLNIAFPNDHIYNLDIYSLFQQVLANPDYYGFTNTTQSVITSTSFSGSSFSATANFPNTTINPDTFLFWDQLHPTSAVHNLIGEMAYNLLPEPSTGLLIAIGFVITAARRKSSN